MELLDQYLLEVIAAIAVLTILSIILLIKSSAKQTERKAPPTEKETELEKPTIEPIKVEEPKKDVEVEKTVVPKEETPVKATVDRTKRELIPHSKITKDDFTQFEGVRILVAEDNLINQKVITALLANSGIEVIIANDGQECLNILKNDTNFSIILMDAHMPVLDGFQATRHIRKDPAYEHIPVIALSGDTAADDIRNMLNVGMERHLEKPLRLDALYDILYIYTSGKEKELSSSEENQTASSMEFDSDKGLDICGGDKEFFLEILNDFMMKYSESADHLRDNLNLHETSLANNELLDISGVAANIGADNLHRAALALKDSIAHPDDLEYINLLKEFKRSLIHVTDAIKEYQDNN